MSTSISAASDKSKYKKVKRNGKEKEKDGTRGKKETNEKV